MWTDMFCDYCGAITHSGITHCRCGHDGTSVLTKPIIFHIAPAFKLFCKGSEIGVFDTEKEAMYEINKLSKEKQKCTNKERRK